MSDTSSTGERGESWIEWFCALEGHEMFCEVERSYIEDGFNLYGLRLLIPNLNQSLDMILDKGVPDDSDDELLQSSYMLYGLIHARYIITTSGLEAMHKKYTMQDFGRCPRFYCGGASVIPVGLRDEPKVEGVKLFCPSCEDLYVPWSSPASPGQIDGSYFGSTFAHLFCMTYQISHMKSKEAYVPRIFGFRIHRKNEERSLTNEEKSMDKHQQLKGQGEEQGMETGSPGR